jgi:Flp pilus assembly pilin Flp
MRRINPLNDPAILYLRALLGDRLHRLRTETDRSRGASAIEWAIITALLAAIALGVGVLIKQKVEQAAGNIKTG